MQGNTKRYNICIVCDYSPYLPIGGIEKVLYNTIRELQHIFNVYIMTTSNNTQYSKNIESNLNVHIINVSKYFGNTYSRKLFTYLRFFMAFIKSHKQYNFHIVHSHSNQSGFPTIIASKLLRIPHISTIHFAWPICVKCTLLQTDNNYCNYRYSNNRLKDISWCIKTCYPNVSVVIKSKIFLSMIMNRLMLKCFNNIICLNPDIKERLYELGVNENKLSFIPNPSFTLVSSTSRTSKLSLRKEFGLLSSDKLIIYVGRIVHEKGVDILIKSMVDLPDSVKLLIIGNSTKIYLNYLKKLIIENKLMNRVGFTGYVSRDQIIKAYRECDVFVHPARWYEMLPTTLLEVMQFKKPVVASNTGGSRWILSNNRGLLFNNSDSIDLSSAIKECLFDNKLNKEISDNGYKFVNNITKDVYIEMLKKIYLLTIHV